jgi:hypothetical protein
MAMKFRLRRRWWPWLAGAMAGYIAWDILDQTMLQPRAGLLGGYFLDWGVVGLVGFTTILIVQRRLDQSHAVIHDPSASTRINPLVLEHILSAARALDMELGEINSSVGKAMGEESLQQQRSLRQAMIAVHNAQSLNDEIAGLLAAPRAAAPPPPDQLAVNNYQ